MTFANLIQDKDNIQKILYYTSKKYTGEYTADEFTKQLNEEFNTDWAQETWQRYTSVLFELDQMYSEKTVKSMIDKRVIQHQVNHNRKMITDIARKDIIAEAITRVLTEVKPTVYKGEWQSVPKSDHDINVIIGDIHYKDDRTYIDKFFSELVTEYGDKPIHLFLNGDLVYGLLRLDDLFEGSIDVVQQGIDLANLVIEWFPKVNIQSISVLNGNHDELRMTGYKGHKNTNVAKIVHAVLQNALPCDVTYGEMLEEESFRIEHGHFFRGKQKMIEFGKKFGKENNKLVIMSHMHSPEVHERMVITPALIPSDDYAKSLNLQSAHGWTSVINGAVKFHLWEEN